MKHSLQGKSEIGQCSKGIDQCRGIELNRKIVKDANLMKSVGSKNQIMVFEMVELQVNLSSCTYKRIIETGEKKQKKKKLAVKNPIKLRFRVACTVEKRVSIGKAGMEVRFDELCKIITMRGMMNRWIFLPKLF